MSAPAPEAYGYRAIIKRSDAIESEEFEVKLSLSAIRNRIPFADDIPSTVAWKSRLTLRPALSLLLGSPWDADRCIDEAASGKIVECWLRLRRWPDILRSLRSSEARPIARKIA